MTPYTITAILKVSIPKTLPINKIFIATIAGIPIIEKNTICKNKIIAKYKYSIVSLLRY